jgi:CHU_C Type IX secretion signal domain
LNNPLTITTLSLVLLLAHITATAQMHRWGARVFEARNPNDCWDGTFKGKSQPVGAYPYVIKAHTFCGEIFLKGVVMLVR